MFMALFSVLNSYSWDFDRDGIYYNILSEDEKEVEIAAFNPTVVSSEIIIPAKVFYSDMEYSVKSIGHDAFSGCGGLTSITIPNSITPIGQYAFQFCDNAKSLSIPESVTCIGQGAFHNCDSLKSVYSYSRTPISLHEVFDSETYSTATLYIPEGCVDAYRNTGGWNNFQNIQSFTTTDVEMIPYEYEADRVANTLVPIIKTIENGKLIITLPDGSKFNSVGIKVE